MKPLQSTLLHSNWRFRQLDTAAGYPQIQIADLPWLPAEVPGAIHLDLWRNGVIGDPFFRLNEAGLGWVDKARWAYETTFSWAPTEGLPQQILKFHGLDTVATVTLNGMRIGSGNNMFMCHEFNVTNALVVGQNSLVIHFESAVREGERLRREYFEAEGLAWSTGHFDERAFVRKAQFMSGWDWGPRLVSCGIWAPVELLEFAGRIKQVSFLQEPLGDGRFAVWAEGTVEGEGVASATIAGQTVPWGHRVEVSGDLWWPAGEGPQNRIECTAHLSTGHNVTNRIGLRTIRLLRERDEAGRCFEFEVNGRRLWARGANWIPDDSFPCRINASSVKERVRTCAELGMNMLRVWGGGLYESEAFYDACDEAGILVWQDFPYACSFYPDSDAFREEAKAEAESQVLRVRDRACLALLCGNNENEAMWVEGWAKESSPPRYYGEAIFDEDLRAVSSLLAPDTPYIRSSPMAVQHEEGEEGHIGRWGDSHYWDVWHGRGDWVHYQDSHTRFSSEYGFASSCGLSAWSQVLLPEDNEPHGFVVRGHDKTNKGHETFHGYVELHYPPSKTLEDWTYFSQLNQRDALRCAIEHYRRSSTCRGSLIWQMNDCWPVQSWALEDYARHLKVAGHEMRRLYAPTLISLKSVGEYVEVWLINDCQKIISTSLQWQITNTVTGQILSAGSVVVKEEPECRHLVTQIDVSNIDPSQAAVCAFLSDDLSTTAWHLLEEPKHLKTADDNLRIRWENQELVISISKFVADLVVWDPDDGENVRSPVTGRPGWFAMTSGPGEIRVPAQYRPKRICLRALGIQEEIDLDN